MAGKLILVVEDNARVRETMKARLEGAGHRVACAADGREALDRLQQPDRPALILLDLAMPVMDGWEFLARRRQSAPLASIPVLLVSGEAGLAGAASSLGAAGHFPKPVRFDRLLEAVRALDEGPRAP